MPFKKNIPNNKIVKKTTVKTSKPPSFTELKWTFDRPEKWKRLNEMMDADEYCLRIPGENNISIKTAMQHNPSRYTDARRKETLRSFNKKMTDHTNNNGSKHNKKNKTTVPKKTSKLAKTEKSKNTLMEFSLDKHCINEILLKSQSSSTNSASQSSHDSSDKSIKIKKINFGEMLKYAQSSSSDDVIWSELTPPTPILIAETPCNINTHFEDVLLKSQTMTTSSSNTNYKTNNDNSGNTIKIQKIDFDTVSLLSKSMSSMELTPTTDITENLVHDKPIPVDTISHLSLSLSSMDIDENNLSNLTPPISKKLLPDTRTNDIVTPLISAKQPYKNESFKNSDYKNEHTIGSNIIPVSSARHHQGNEKFGEYAGLQCMVIASTAAVYSILKNRIPFNTNEMDTILNDGTKIYAGFLASERLAGRNSSARMLYAEEIPTQIKIDNFNIEIEKPIYKYSELYPMAALHKEKHILDFSNYLESLFTTADYDPTKDGFIFTFQGYTVSFWKHETSFYLFNSHAVGLNGNVDKDTPEFNRARLFKIQGEQSLARFLLIDGRHGNDYNQYEIMKIRMVNYREIAPIATNLNDNDDCVMITSTIDTMPSIGQVKRGRGRPRKIITIDNNDNYDTTSTTSTITSTSTTGQKKRGRPCKVKRGPKKQKINAHADAQAKYVKNKPEASIIASQKYKQNNPDHIKDDKLKYKTGNVSQIKETKKQYAKQRKIPINLRNVGLIGQLSGDALDQIQQHKLKKTSLLSDDIYKCPHCGAKLFEEEKTRAQWCCGSNRYNVLNLPPLEEPFYLDPTFVRRSRIYNNMYAFSALQTSGTVEPIRGGFINFIKIQGRTYHRICDLSCTSMTNNLNYYVYDENERYEKGDQLGLNKEIMIEIRNYLDGVNPFIDQFKRLSLEPSEDAFLTFQHTTRTSHGPNLGSRVSNSEVAAIISCDESEIQPRSITVWKTGDAKAHTVPILNKLYEPLHYTLLYPHGNAGWYLNMLQNPTTSDNNTPPPRLTQLKYCRCLFLSDWRFSEMGRLSEEWQVDMICRIQEERLNYIRSTQNAWRSAPLNELIDAQARQLANDLNADETIALENEEPTPGRVYLPNTYTGGPRYMATKYFDGIALVNKKGRPSYFLTFTCNPSWPEITQSKMNTCYTPTLPVVRVYNLKQAELISDLNSGLYFGSLDYRMHVIEFQKRGLPHTHLCFRVTGGGPTQNIEIDKVVRADIPSETEAGGRLRKLVLKHMIHGPCDPEHFNMQCYNTEKGKCEKYFPKQATDVTYIDNKGFVVYKRNPANTAIIKNRKNNQNIVVSDLNVVPYNAPLLLKYDCHINLEIASTRKVVKYLFKYITKGPDLTRVAVVNNPPVPQQNCPNRTQANVDNNASVPLENAVNNNNNINGEEPATADPIAPRREPVNEIEEYVTKRYIGSCEAAWRLLSFDLTERIPLVRQLPVHLLDGETILFKKGEQVNRENATSLLLIYFKRPLDAEFDNVTYAQFYEKYIIHTKRKSTKAQMYECTDRKHFVTKRFTEAIARLYWQTPRRSELYYLRMLLEVYAARSYEDLLALGGPACTTFQQAARNVGLADDEQEYERSLIEASSFYTGRKLRHFFVLLITNGAPASLLWENHKQALSEDYYERLQNEERAYYQALCEIDRLLRKHGTCVNDHGLPEVHDDTTELGRERVEFACQELQLTEFVEEWLPQLCLEQRDAFEHVRMLLHNDNYKHHDSKTSIFIQGCSGSGKTLLLNLITAYVRGPLKRVVICVATSGIAALNYENGITAHSMFKLPIELTGDDTGVWGISNSTQRAELIRQAAVIIYDEAPMAHKHLIHMLDRSLQDLMDSPKMFGGKIVILAGDFRQIPPIVPKARCPDDIVRASLITSPLWQKIHKISLVRAQRTRTDNDYSDFLLKLGSGTLETVSFGEDRSTQNLISLANIDTCDHLEELMSFVFPEEILSANPDECAARAILTMYNINVRGINSIILNRVHGEEIHLYSADSVETDLAQEFRLASATLNQVQSNSAPNHNLVIKKGCVCMIIRNLSFVDRLVNGTKVIIVDATPRIVTVRKPNSQELFPIPRISFKIPIEPGSPIEMTRQQFPLQVSYAMTVHKSQGQTINRVGLDLRSDIFSHGQLYVALGRVRSRDDILILINRSRMYNGIPHANNVIIKRLLG